MRLSGGVGGWLIALWRAAVGRVALAGIAMAAFALALLCAPRPAMAYDDGITSFQTIAAGSYIVDMGVPAQTVNNALKPYGLVYDLVRNYRVPVAWAINPAKAKDGTDFTDPNSGKSYAGGPFIIEARYVTASVLSVINTWKGRGVVIDGPTTGPITGVPVYDVVQGLANIVLDFQNGSIAAAFFNAAGVPSTAYSYKYPSDLNSCDDLFAMPHADPTWATHGNLISFSRNKGYIWAGCHAVSVMENLDDPGTPTVNPDMNFLSTTGLVPFGSHGDGSPPYTQILPSHPVMQFLGTTDAAQQGGSEQIYLPKLGGSWRPGAQVLVSDSTVPADIPSKSAGPAAAIVVGRAFDNGLWGRVMYEGGHNVGGTADANIAAQRAFLNFWLLALLDRSPGVTLNVPTATVNEGSSLTLSSTTQGAGSVSYQWISSAGGTFSAPNSPTTQFTPPEVSADTVIDIRLIITDACGRTGFAVVPVTVRNVPKADLAITKTDSADPVSTGQAFSYTLGVSNLGTETATSVVVEDVLPAGMGFVSASGSGWSCAFSAGKLTCTRASLGLTGSTPSNIVVNVTAPAVVGLVSNTATVTSALPDLNTANNSATQTTQVLQGIDVAITKTAPATPIYPGQSFSYTLTVQNISALSATSLTVTDVLPSGPPGLTFVSASGSGWNCVYRSSDRTVTCFLATLAANASSVITLTVTPSGSAGNTISNTATVSSPDFTDQNPANNTSTVAITLTATADLSIAKTGSTTGGGGTQVDTYTVTLTNNGPGTATNIVVTDRMSGVDVTKYASGCTVTPSTGTLSSPSPWAIATLQAGATWSIASLANGASATLGFSCTGDNNNGVTNSVSVVSSSYDPNPTNDQASAFVVDGAAKNLDMTITKTDSPDPVLVGQTLTYTITVTNTTNNRDAKGSFTVTDTLPPGVTYLGFNALGNGWSCTHAGGVVTCTTASDINRNTSRSLQIQVTAPLQGGFITNTAVLRYTSANDEYDPTANNTATATTEVIYPTTDIALAKTVNNATPVVGANVVFTVTASNTGSVGATNVRVTDLLPAGFTYVSGTVSQGSYNPATGLWYVGALAGAASATMTVTAQVGVGASTNTACLYALDQTDSNGGTGTGGNNCASASVTPQYADLALTKTVPSAIVNHLSNTTFTVTLTNNGPSTATGITVQDVLPEGLQYVSHTASGGSSYNATSGVWSVSSLANGASVTLALTARVMLPNVALTNTATILASGMPDPVTSNNAASASVTGQSADIQVSKTVDNAVPLTLGTPVTFTVTAKNNGPSAATGVTLRDVLPSGLTYSSATVSQGTWTMSSGTGTWVIGGLADGASATLTLQATTAAFGNLTNTATKTALDQYDPDTTNDQASASVLSGGSADLEVTKIVDKPDTFQGGQVTFTIRLRNYGPNPATGVVLTDLLPAGLTYVSHVAGQGSYNPATGVWTVGNVAVGQQLTLLVTATATNSGVMVNSAAVTAMNQADPDPSNNSASTSVNAQPASDLAITKAGPASVPLGSTITYTIVATNNGPTAASGVRITDSVPSQITGVSWTCVAAGTADCDTTLAGTGATGSGNSIALSNAQINAGAGNSLTITVTGTASATGTLVNTAIVAPPANNSIYDTNVANNSASVSTLVSNLVLTGRVFADTGTGGGVANNGILDGGEIGIAKVALRLTDCGVTTYSSTTTAGDGRYALAIPSNLSAGASLCVVESNLTGYVSTGGQAGNTGGTYDRATDRVQFTLASNVSYANINFGDVPENRLLTDGTRTALPGSTVTYAHIFIAGTGGQVSFSTTAASSPAVGGWTSVLYLDANCDGVLTTPTDSLLSGAITVTEGQQLCLLHQQFVPAGLAAGASNLVSLQASFTYVNAAPALLGSYARQDLTTATDVALQLYKEVRNVTRNGPWAITNQAREGDELEYRITFTTVGATPIQSLVIRDATPAFTVFVSAECGTPPANLTTCNIIAPAPLSMNGALQWQFGGSLSPGVPGVVNYRVKLQ